MSLPSNLTVNVPESTGPVNNGQQQGKSNSEP